MTAQQSLAAGAAALEVGRWDDARTAFEDAVATGETAEGHFGLAAALWWLGENHGSVTHCTRAYSLFRRSGEVAGAVQCALWLAIVYKANFANFAAANGWIARADRLLEPLDPGPLHAHSWVARAYRMPDLRAAQELTGRALGVARVAADVDLELTALSQLGLIRVGRGETAVARRVRPDIDWRQGDAGALPPPGQAFDAALCQMALMFFPERAAALREMGRVAAANGTVAVLVPCGLDAQPAYGPFVDMAAHHAGAEARSLLSAYFACGDLDELRGLFASAGLRVTSTRTHGGTARFPSVDAAVATEVESTPLRERITDDVYERIRVGAHEVLAPFTTDDGRLEAPFGCHVVVAGRS
ncbi:MAG: class I SAM-dependent methyltransferase [Acidimicrobiales bacterium]